MSTNQVTYDIEYTDTFGGEANYTWVKRYEITLPSSLSQKTVNRIAKELVDITGCKGTWEEIGGIRRFTPTDSHTVLFIIEKE